MCIFSLSADWHQISSLIFSEKQWKNIQDCRRAAVVIGALWEDPIRQSKQTSGSYKRCSFVRKNG